MPAARETNEAVRDRILEAASARFRQFGYGKTTMAEIAQDCAMSAANLYRYFDNKRDIGAALACRCLEGKEALLAEIAASDELGAADKVRQLVLQGLRYTHEQWQRTPRLNELVEDISRSRHDMVHQHMQHRLAGLVQVIEQGNTSGEFDVADPQAAAEAILSATFLFDFPNVMDLYPLQQFEHKAVCVTELLLTGMLRC